jgi:hypothetical protein
MSTAVSFREFATPEAQFPGRPLLGISVNRGSFLGVAKIPAFLVGGG